MRELESLSLPFFFIGSLENPLSGQGTQEKAESMAYLELALFMGSHAFHHLANFLGWEGAWGLNGS